MKNGTSIVPSPATLRDCSRSSFPVQTVTLIVSPGPNRYPGSTGRAGLAATGLAVCCVARRSPTLWPNKRTTHNAEKTTEIFIDVLPGLGSPRELVLCDCAGNIEGAMLG